MKIIVGLGNPGEKYKNTRHNIGFLMLEYLSREKKLTWKTNKKFQAEICHDCEEDIIYLKPLTFMNNSGLSVRALLSYYKLLPKTMGILDKKNSDLSEILFVIHDDLDIDFGKYKMSINSGPAGHNGILSIINHLKTKNFSRLRLGIKPEDKKKENISNFVLGRFNRQEMEIVNKTIKGTIDEYQTWTKN